MVALRLVALGVWFFLEIAALASFAYWGATLRMDAVVRLVVSAMLPLLTATFWGTFVSPRARLRPGPHGQTGLGILVFLSAVAALHSRHHSTMAAVFAVAIVVAAALISTLPAAAPG